MIPDPNQPPEGQSPSILRALTVYGEARGEPIAGKQGVAHAIDNRMRLADAFLVRHGHPHPLFGDGTVAACVLKPWQFSCWNPNDPNRQHLLDFIKQGPITVGDLTAWADCVNAGETASTLPDPTQGATHYVVVGLWGKDRPGAWYGEQEITAGRTVRTVQLGNQVFARVA